MYGDPFFAIGHDPNWNACIGQQGDEENYADGFIDAAVELITSLFEKEQYDKRDTLVLPILYNTRHGIELALKMAISELVDMNVIAERHAQNHDILSHYNHLKEARLGDEMLVKIVGELEPFVLSLSQIDGDGQEFRYHETQGGQQSLAGHAITSLILIRDSLGSLKAVLVRLKHRIYDLRFERTGGFFTPDLSRRDLLNIAECLPDRADWGEPVFAEVRSEIKGRYGIGNRKFADALNLIQKNRKAASLIGLHAELKSLSDEKCRLLVSKHAELYPKMSEQNKARIVQFSAASIERFLSEENPKWDIMQLLEDNLNLADIADAEVIFYLGRNDELPETYESRHLASCNELNNTGELSLKLNHVFSKLNYRMEFIQGLRALGKTELAAQLADIGDAA